MLAAGELRAAAREEVVDANRRRLGRRYRPGVRDEHLEPRTPERAPSERPEMLDADVVGAVFVRECPLGAVVAADAEVLVRKAREVVPDPQRLVERERVVHLPVHEQVVAWSRQLQRLGAGAGREDRVEVRRVVSIRAEYKQAKRAL